MIENERKETLRIACRQFKEGCPNYDSIAVIMIDKDFTELAVLQEEFPGARILLCHFHVVKYLQEEVAKEKYNLDAWTKKEMKRLIQLLVGAPTEVAYANIITAMKVVLRTDEKKELWFSYFDKNWTTCKERWSSAYRGNVPHMGNHTNNRYVQRYIDFTVVVAINMFTVCIVDSSLAGKSLRHSSIDPLR